MENANPAPPQGAAGPRGRNANKAGSGIGSGTMLVVGVVVVAIIGLIVAAVTGAFGGGGSGETGVSGSWECPKALSEMCSACAGALESGKELWCMPWSSNIHGGNCADLPPDPNTWTPVPFTSSITRVIADLKAFPVFVDPTATKGIGGNSPTGMFAEFENWYKSHTGKNNLPPIHLMTLAEYDDAYVVWMQEKMHTLYSSSGTQTLVALSGKVTKDQISKILDSMPTTGSPVHVASIRTLPGEKSSQEEMATARYESVVMLEVFGTASGVVTESEASMEENKAMCSSSVYDGEAVPVSTDKTGTCVEHMYFVRRSSLPTDSGGATLVSPWRDSVCKSVNEKSKS